MRFEGGEKCGETPRGLAVRVACGDADRLLSEAEPAACRYEMEMESPAACDAAALAAHNLDAAGDPVVVAAAAAAEAVEKDVIVYHDEL